MQTVALIVAAGRGTRVGGDIPKQYMPLAGRPVLWHSVAAFAGHPAIDGVRVVIHGEDRPIYERATANLRLLEPVLGGVSRQELVLRGLESLEMAAPTRVLIHDAARPLIGADVIASTVAALTTGPGAIAAVPVSDTLKRAGASNAIVGTLDRASLWRAQTPQAFHFRGILSAHRASVGLELTDDAAVAERAGIPVTLVPASEDNIKVTTPEDFARAEAILAARRGDVRVASGFDVHRFGPGDAVMLCGVRVPFGQGLEGHSDADVGLHALTDALLGTIGAGDIGVHFPPNDARWKGAASSAFVQFAVEQITRAGGSVSHVDVTVIAEAPKVSPHRVAMVQRIAELVGVTTAQVSVKATTTEGLGFTGRREGIAAQATATIRMPFRA